MVRDKEGKKMSKSVGNVIDPTHVIEGRTLDELLSQIPSHLSAKERNKLQQTMTRSYPQGIPQCGVDALRATLLAYMQQGTISRLYIVMFVSKLMYDHVCDVQAKRSTWTSSVSSPCESSVTRFGKHRGL